MKPRLLLYCQHSLGLGHFYRSLALADALAENFDIVFFNGGPAPALAQLPPAIRFIHLPPLRMEEDGSLSGKGDVATIMAERRQTMLTVAAEAPVAALVVELYPFGRKKFASEIDPLVEQTRAQGGKILCSVRDVLVTERLDQARHDQRAADKLNALFDAVLVHSDERIFRLEDSFKPDQPLQIPVWHTGFVTRMARQCEGAKGDGTLVTAGGGIVGQAIYQAAVDAQRILWKMKGWPMTIVAGPLFPEVDWQALKQQATDVGGLTLVREVPSMALLLAQSGRVVSQCGYNSALEIVQYCLPTLFVPFARGQESEQGTRARQFKQLGLSDWMPESALSGATLAERLTELPAPAPKASLNLDGARASARLISEMTPCMA
jgi:predicted glycosyltransferase